MARVAVQLPVLTMIRCPAAAARCCGSAFVLALTLTGVACQSAQTATPSATAVPVTVTPVALNPMNPSQQSVGRFVYAGGVALEAPTALRFGGLSDIDVTSSGRMVAVSDAGRFVEASLVLDRQGRLSDVVDVRTTQLVGTDGRPLVEKVVADAEGLAILPSGDRLVSFERQHRIWRYPSGGGLPVPAPTPESASSLSANAGLEALTVLPGGTGSRAYLAGSEGGVVWLCRLDDGCRETALGTRVPEDYGLTALAASPDGETVALLSRLFDPQRGVRIVVRLVGRTAIDSPSMPLLDELVLSEPLTRDNFEGIAVVNGGQPGILRLYLLSDNNFSDSQKNYLLAFDWKK